MSKSGSKSGNGVREVPHGSGKYVVTMYDKRVRGGTKHVGVFRVGTRPGEYATRAEAREVAVKAKRAAEVERDLQLKAEANETVAHFQKRWTRDYPRPKESTNRHNEERTRALVADFGERPLTGDGSITREEAYHWIMGGIVPPQLRKSARKWDGAKLLPDGEVEIPSHLGNLQACRVMFNDAKRTLPNVGDNPFVAHKWPKASRGRAGDAIEVVTQAELNELVGQARKIHGDYGRHYGALIECAAWTGLRPGELWALRQEDVDFEEKVIWVRATLDRLGKRTPTKTKAGYRQVTMLPQAERAFEVALETARAQGEREAVFISSRGRPFSARVAYYYWNPVRCAAGRPAMDFYEMRHHFGTYLARILRLTPYEIAEEMGHADGGRTAMERYIHTHRDSGQRERIRERAREAERRGERVSVGENVDEVASTG